MQDPEPSQATETTQEPTGNSEKGPGDFDLNEEVYSDKMASPSTPSSAPITVASTKAAAASGIPAAPLRSMGRFMGSLGSHHRRWAKAPNRRERLSSLQGLVHPRRYAVDV
ncbi:hypothetical protein NE237_018084 [Protea cynaroides]|uniref:Uncharacterized protein n=1 Tax=Protea cynaroides TaxID=273540 RepID=A0A9Q0QNL4_9MAGN|nr:hypothetical protein NE237_018084 [Protea cynaroides]